MFKKSSKLFATKWAFGRTRKKQKEEREREIHVIERLLIFRHELFIVLVAALRVNTLYIYGGL